ncbi:hypothetical protein [Duganella sp. P38]|uniref:hypothetical protein n=1 Tax=Duganella sp. P38 TaxID=3423949 RepID=UPI003D79D4D1
MPAEMRAARGGMHRQLAPCTTAVQRCIQKRRRRPQKMAVVKKCHWAKYFMDFYAIKSIAALDKSSV